MNSSEIKKKNNLFDSYNLFQLLYFSAVLNPYEGFLRALSVVAGTHMPRLQKPVLAMEAEKIHSISER